MKLYVSSLIWNETQKMKKPHVVDKLVIDDCPPGTTSHLLLNLTHNALALPIQLPILVMRGAHPGPVCGITSTLHGNEINGIPVIHHLFQKIKPANLKGTIVAVVVVNVPSFKNLRRQFNDKTDLNHIMPGVENGNESQVYAYRFVHQVVKQFNYLIDLHTASFGRINSLYVRADMSHPLTAKMARLQRPSIILHNPPSDATLRGTAMELGIPAITVEIGNPHVFQTKHIRSSFRGIRRVLADLEMITNHKTYPDPQPVLCQSSYWLYTDYGGLLEVFPDVTTFVKVGELIARQTNIFGQVVREYHTPEDGIIIGKSTNPVGQTGSRILHLGIVSDEYDKRPE